MDETETTLNSIGLSSVENAAKVYISVCPLCKKIPRYELISPTSILATCECKKYCRTMTIKEFIERKSNPPSKEENKCFECPDKKKADKFCINCLRWLCNSCLLDHARFVKNHQLVDNLVNFPFCKNHGQHRKDIDSYCIDCEKHFCSSCEKGNHEKHEIESIFELLNSDCINKIDEILIKANQKLTKYYEFLKNQVLKQLKKFEAKIEKSYEYCMKINTALIDYFNNLLYDYRATNSIINYTTIANLKLCYENVNLTQLDLKSMKGIDQMIKEINKYLKNDQILLLPEIKKIGEMDLSNLQVSKILEPTGTELIYSVICLSDGNIAAGIKNNVALYSGITFERINTLKGHTKQIFSITEISDNRFVTCSEDKTIKVWIKKEDSNEYNVKTLNGHTYFVLKAIQLSNKKYLASCSYDKTIKIWNDNPEYTLENTFNKRDYWINSIIELEDKRLVAASEEKEVVFYDTRNVKRKDPIKVIKGIQCCWFGSMLELKNKKLLFGGMDRIVVLNTENYKIEDVLIDQQNPLNFVRSLHLLRDGTVLCGCNNGKTHRYYPGKKEKKLLIFIGKMHDEGVLCIGSIKPIRIITSSLNIKIWENVNSE